MKHTRFKTKSGKVVVFYARERKRHKVVSFNGTAKEQNIRCGKCGYMWKTKSSHIYVSCPSCLKKVRNGVSPDLSGFKKNFLTKVHKKNEIKKR